MMATMTRIDAQPLARDYPARITPPSEHLRPLAFAASFVRNPLETIPQAVYEQSFVRYEKGRVPLIWLTDAEHIKTVLLDRRADFHKTTQQRLLGPLLGNGILTADGADWKWQRQASAPMFRHQDIMALVPAVVTAAEHYVAKLKGGAPTQRRAIDADMTEVTYDVISATLLPSGDGNVAPAIHTNAGSFQSGTGWQLLYAVAGFPNWLPRPGKKKTRRSIAMLRGSVHDLIRQRRASGTAPDDLMQRLMAARDPETGKTMSDEQLVDNLLTFYLAGHETTAKALTWTLYLLSREPEWEQRLLAEITAVAGNATITAEHIDKLTLTTAVIKESMRLYPPAPQIGRTALKDCAFGDQRVAAGTQVTIPIYAIQRHRKYWTDPDRFDPNRFSPENEAKISRYHYMPFGAGPRICIGMAFAIMEATAILATMLRAANFKADPGFDPTPLARVTLVPKGGMPMTVRLR
jgi:cytochrome P450